MMFNGKADGQTKPRKLFNDCVHGHILVPPLCVAIIDTEIFQRLRNIKQLGLGYMVYPGASHNRFEHCLGVCHFAGKMVEALNQNHQEDILITDKEKLCLQVAGLCHDLGHGPFSHTWEHFLEFAGVINWKHEEMSIKMFDELCKKKKIQQAFSDSGLIEDDKTFIKQLILGSTGTDDINTLPHGDKPFLYEIISNSANGVDVDKWDYLLRDGQKLNINVTFDPHRLLQCSRIATASTTGKRHISFRNKERGNIYHMYMMRAELSRVAYQHPVTMVIEHMWMEALLAAEEAGYRFLGKRLTEAHEDPRLYTKLTDHIFYDILSREDGRLGAAQDLLQRILQRELYVRTGSVSLASADREQRVERIRQRTLERPQLQLCAHTLSLNIPMQDLTRRLYLYDKDSPHLAMPYEDWSAVPVFPMDMQEVERIDVCFFTKATDRETQAAAKEATQNIIAELKPKLYSLP